MIYGLDLGDVWRGRIEPVRALVLAEQLTVDPRSHYRALRLGGIDFVGWDREARNQAALLDALVILIHWGQEPDPEVFAERPRPTEVSAQATQSLGAQTEAEWVSFFGS